METAYISTPTAEAMRGVAWEENSLWSRQGIHMGFVFYKTINSASDMAQVSLLVVSVVFLGVLRRLVVEIGFTTSFRKVFS